MDYRDKKILLTGSHGFIGSKLYGELIIRGADVYQFPGDVRRWTDFSAYALSTRFDYVFHFGSPSSQVLFKRNPGYCIDVTINGFLNVAKLALNTGAKLIYPSTGLLSQGKENEYARCKKILEDIHLGMNLDAIGLRIFAGYGVGEAHKRDYASVIYLFIRDILRGRSPMIYGSGNQKRDFIYIDDLVRAILILAEEADEKIIDVGSGDPTSFNEIIKTINSVLGKNIKPDYKHYAPENYVESTKAEVSTLLKYDCYPKVQLKEGIKNIVLYEKGNRHDDN